MKRIRKIGFTNFIFLISSLILVIILIAFSFTKNAESAAQITQSWQVKNNLRRISASVSYMESRKIAYVYTGQIKYRHAFKASQEEYDSLYEILEQLVDDNPEQTVRLQKVDKIVREHFTNFNDTIESNDDTKLNKVLEVKDEMGYAQEIHSTLDDMDNIENTLLQERNNNYDLWTFLIIIGIVSASFIVGLSLYNLIRKISPIVEEVIETKENLEVSNKSLNNTLEKLNKLNAEKQVEIEAKEKAIQKVEKLNDSLMAKNAQLDHFAYVASHDLQEPLRTVSNYLEIFQEDFPDRIEGDAVMYFDFINSAVDRMRNLISGLLSFSRLGTSGDLEMIDLNEVLDQIRNDFSSIIESRNAKITSTHLPEVEGYRLEMKQLFQNLISNAIKFTPAERDPEVNISYDETENFYNFHIQDNGIGIPDKDFRKVFDMFSRLHSSKEYDGQGIGLAFCKKIVELHHGNIWVTSEFGKGSIIHFTIEK